MAIIHQDDKLLSRGVIMGKIFLFLSLISACVFAEEAKAPPVEVAPPKQEVKPDVSKISEAFGHMIGKNIETMGVKFDIALVIKGLKDASEGRESPMSEAECVQAISAAHEAAFKVASTENLKKAEEFLKTNSSAPGIKSLEEGKLQYRVDKEGTGNVVDEHCAPIIRYSGKFLDGTSFGSKEETRINLEEDELLPGFSKSLLGMKEGEKRTIYIHPELAFGTKNYQLPPNSLITFEIEVLQQHAPAETPADALSTTPSQGNAEVASPLEEQKAVR